MDYFLHRINHESEISYPLLDRGILTYGLSDLSEPHILNNIKTSSNNTYIESIANQTYNSVPNNIYNLVLFVKEIKKNDIILVPTPYNFAFYKAKDCAQLIRSIPQNILKSLPFSVSILNNLLVNINGNYSYDLGYYIEVEKVTNTVPRWIYANALLTRYMKYRGSTLHIRNKEVIDTIQRTIDNINNGITVNDEFNVRISKCLANAIIDCLQPDKMQLLVKKYFDSIGAVTTIPNPTLEEGDCDVIADFPFLKTVIFCQVKHHEGHTNSYSVDQIISFNKNFNENGYDGYTRQLWVISSASSFSDEAIQKAVNNNIQLISGVEFSNMLIDAKIMNLDI